MSHPDAAISLEEHTKGTLLKDAPSALVNGASEAHAQHDIMTRIQKSALIASGFLAGDKKQAFVIPTDLFIRGEVNWKNSTVTYNDEGFTDVRLQLEMRKAPSKNKGKPLAEYPASAQLTENEAALLLGISRRALQAYRLKGGGPAFQTFGKAHKYKAGDLTAWLKANRKS